MDKISVVFLTRGGMPENRRKAIEALLLECQIDLHVIIEKAGREKAGPIREFLRLFQNHGLYSLIFVYRFIIRKFTSIRNDDECDLNTHVEYVEDVHSDKSIDLIEEINPELGIVYGHRIIKPSVFNIPKFGSIGVHAGTVPEYRGKMSDFWEIYNGESSTAVTIQKIEAGVDTGDIVSQKSIPIERGESLDEVREKIHETTRNELVRIVNSYHKNENIQTDPQEESGHLYKVPKLRHRMIFIIKQLLRRAYY